MPRALLEFNQLDSISPMATQHHAADVQKDFEWLKDSLLRVPVSKLNDNSMVIKRECEQTLKVL